MSISMRPLEKISIEIQEPANSVEEMASTLRHIADKLDEGYTSGYYPTWGIKREEDKN